MQCCPTHQQHTEHHPAALSEVCPARPWPLHPHSPHHGTDTRAPPHQAHCAAWPGTTRQSIETNFHGKIRSIFGFWVAEIAQAPTVTQLPICPRVPGGRTVVGLHPCPQAPQERGDTARPQPRQSREPAEEGQNTEENKTTGNSDSQRDQINNKMFPCSTAPALPPTQAGAGLSLQPCSCAAHTYPHSHPLS